MSVPPGRRARGVKKATARSSPAKAKAPARKAGRRSALTPEVAELILEAVRGGAFDTVAADAAGIAPATLRQWKARAEGLVEGRPATPELVAFVADLRQARAEARSKAEARIYKENPLAWLRLGPGRDRGETDEPGWTDQVNVTGAPAGPQVVEVRYINDWREGENG